MSKCVISGINFLICVRVGNVKKKKCYEKKFHIATGVYIHSVKGLVCLVECLKIIPAEFNRNLSTKICRIKEIEFITNKKDKKL